MTFAEYEKVNFNYDVITTFWEDFSMAERFGVKGIKETFKLAFRDSKENYKYLTELVLVMNTKCWNHYNRNDEFSKVYSQLYYKAHGWAMSHLKGEEMGYYFNIVD